MAILVVSDCSPIRALHHLNMLHICQDLYGKVIVPTAVQRELLSPTAACPAIEIATYAGFEIRSMAAKPSELGVPLDLDPGETEAIAVALELHADLLLMDERKATAAARQLGLATIGVIGVLLEAKRAGMIDAVLPHIDRLVAEMRFFCSPMLREQIAQLAGE